MVELFDGVDLAPLHTFGLSARARHLLALRDEAGLSAFLRSGHPAVGLPRLVLGGGSNMLFAADFEGVLLHPTMSGWRFERTDGRHVWLWAEAGLEWDRLVALTVALGWQGLENLSMIPGSVGASPIQNIGAYGKEVAQHVERVRWLDLGDGKAHELEASACGFGYRESIFKGELRGRALVSRVLFRLNLRPELELGYGDLRARVEALGQPTPERVRRAVVAIRSAKLPDPRVLGNAGSFFKNPLVPKAQADQLRADFPEMPRYEAPGGMAKLAAGWLIERCGLKGHRVGAAGVHERQALVLVNHGGATPNELLELAALVRQRVRDRFGVELEPEVNLVGGP